jgi:Uma2 family endonuclease
MIALKKPSRQPARPRKEDNGQSLVLHDISWQSYKDICAALPEKYLHLSYDRGTLEFMVLSTAHERSKSLIGLLIFVLAEELDRVIGSFGSFTHQRQDLLRGLEPDQCYYLAHFKKVQKKRQIDLSQDPPPDLAVEIEISRSQVDRMGIYQVLKIPEIWRFDGRKLLVHVLKNGRYQVQRASPSFPEITVGDLVRFMESGFKKGDRAMVRAFRPWVRRQVEHKKLAKKK